MYHQQYVYLLDAFFPFSAFRKSTIMGCMKVLFALAVVAGGIAILMMYPPLSEYADIVKATVEPLTKHLPFLIDSTGAKPQIFTKAELAQYDGSPGSKGLYLAILGKVYDVSKGARHYGPGGGYSFFAGIFFSPLYSQSLSSPSAMTIDSRFSG